MLFRQLGPAEIIIIVLLLVLVFGWKRLPDAARSLGRSARVFKSEVDEMKKEAAEKSAASSATVPGETVQSPPAQPQGPISENRPQTDDTPRP